MSDDTENNTLSNTTMTFEAVLKQTREFGRDSGAGNEALPKLAVVVMRAATEGVITLDANKHGEGIDDAKFLYDEYVKSESKKAVHEQTADGKKAQVSKLRAIVKAGVGSGTDYDGIVEFDKVLNARKAAITADPKSVKPAYHALIEASRKLVETNEPLTAEQIDAIVKKGETAQKTVEQELEGIKKKLEKLITGESSIGKDQSEQVVKAHELISERLAAMITTRTNAEKRAQFELLAKELAEAA
jgi:hypothetical protein